MRKIRKRPEQSLHLAVARYLSGALRPPTFWTSIEHATKLGLVAAAMRKRRGVKAGIPDILVLHPLNGAVKVLGIELKAPGGRMSDAQDEMQKHFMQCNAVYEICDSLDSVIESLTYNEIPLHAKL